MKINKTVSPALEQFQKTMMTSFANYYRQSLSDNIKRGLALKKARELSTCPVNKSKV